jgi:putative transposase
VNKWVTPHALIWSLGNTPFAREVAYLDMVQAGVSPAQQASLTHSALTGWTLGSEKFVDILKERTGHKLTPAKAGRPRLAKD